MSEPTQPRHDDELDDQELEAASGGRTILPYDPIICPLPEPIICPLPLEPIDLIGE